MGCVNSVPEDEDEKKKEELAKQQRRRLSVAPEHVGDISDNAGSKPDAKQEAPAAAGAAIEVAVDPAAGRVDVEAKLQGKVRHYLISKKGYVPYNKFKVNQDRGIVKYALRGDPDLALFAIMDGHGEFGHFVAGFVMEKLPLHIERQENLKSEPPKAIIKAVRDMVDELATTTINIAFSGTTCVFGLKVGDMLYVGNIGDSRCVLCFLNDKNQPEAIALSQDQKPDVPEEKARIIAAGGRVEPLPGPPEEDCGPPRVWLADVDVPGLAMSRSIGDEVSQTVGVISVPEIRQYQLTERDQFAIWASDGIWEFISNQEAVNMVYKYQDDLATAAKELVEEAHKRWSREEEVVDDITCIIARFH
jgi:serine/threonine protein phosphatase PrpC